MEILWYAICCGLPLALVIMFSLSLNKARRVKSNYTEFGLTNENFYGFYGVNKDE